MPIHLPPPDDPELLVRRVLESVGSTFGDNVTLTSFWRVETVDLRAFVEAGGLVPADQSARRWQCLVGDDHPRAAVDLVEDGGDFAVVSINDGALANAMNEAASIAEALADDGEFQFRSIEFPAAHVVAARLVASEGPELDRFVPLQPHAAADADAPLRPYQPDELADVLSAYLDGEIA